MITSFTKDYVFLSNFYNSAIVVDSIIYSTVEHAYQAMKTIDKKERIKISELSSPGAAKRYGQKVELRPKWDDIKIYKHLKQLLIETDPHELFEGNEWGDSFWGVYGGRGYNHLGRILMVVRELLKTKV